jgi:haloalkane dehalogenase
MHYVDEGPRAGSTLLMVHGNPTWSFYFRSLISAFGTEHRVVAPDHIGCGLSDKPQAWSYRLADHIENLEALVRGLDLADITLVMHDWGGAIGMGFASRNPERVARLVILNSAAFLSDRVPLRIRACRAPIVGEFLVRRMNAFAGMAPRMASARRGGISAEAKHGLLWPYDSYANRIAVSRFVQDIPLSSKDPSYATVQEIERGIERFRDLPACIVWGERDFCFTPEFRRMWLRHLPSAETHVLADAGHYVLEDAPAEVERAIAAFLARHAAPARPVEVRA